MASIGTRISWLQDRNFSIITKIRLKGVWSRLTRCSAGSHSARELDITAEVIEMVQLICTRTFPWKTIKFGWQKCFVKSCAWEVTSLQMIYLKNRKWVVLAALAREDRSGSPLWPPPHPQVFVSLVWVGKFGVRLTDWRIEQRAFK